jgi:CHAT domain-containing protein
MVKYWQYFCLGLFVTLLTLFPPLVNNRPWTSPAVAVETPGKTTEAQLQMASTPAELVSAGKQRYQSGQFAEAIALWQQASVIFAKSGDFVNQAAVLSNLALAHQQLGQWPQANQTLSASLDLLKAAKSPNKEIENLRAQALNIQGNLQLAQGQAEAAFATWQQAVDIYTQLGNQGEINRTLLNQSQALRVMGLYPRSRKILENVNQNLETQPDSIFKAVSLLNLGDTLRVMGDLNTATESLQKSLAIAQKFNSPDHITLAFLSLGNIAFFRQDMKAAQDYYQQAISQSPAAYIKLQAQLNLLRLLANTKQWSETETLITQIAPQIQNLTLSRPHIYAQVNFVQSLQKISVHHKSVYDQLAAKTLALAIQQAKTIGDQRAESYALGYLGSMYEQTRQWPQAQELTEKALILAKISNAADVSYLWQWQLGRISQATGNTQLAIDFYDDAVKTLTDIRNDLIAANTNIQLSFRDSVEPVYRELVALLLQSPKTAQVSQSNLNKARDVIEGLKLAELDNYFQEACLTGRIAKIDQVDPQAAIIYPIILRDRLEVILSLSDRPLYHHTTFISQPEMEKIIEKMRSSLRPATSQRERLAIAKQIYDLLIQPSEAELAKNQIKTLVFILDGLMKNLPMSALYDGQQYLVEKYSIAQTPGLQLLAPQPIQRQPLTMLIGGISEARQGFSALPGVNVEVKGINAEIPSKLLLNQTFTSTDIQNLIRTTPFPIVHLATHGQFSSKAQDTFILTWDDRLNVKDLGQLLQSRDQNTRTPIELLVLSACQTAKGDKRAPLGLAGVAVRSGARSTLASLWPVDDESTSEFMVEFYTQLSKSKLTKAEAVRMAQLKLLKQPKFKHPFYWSPFVLVGNWL